MLSSNNRFLAAVLVSLASLEACAGLSLLQKMSEMQMQKSHRGSPKKALLARGSNDEDDTEDDSDEEDESGGQMRDSDVKHPKHPPITDIWHPSSGHYASGASAPTGPEFGSGCDAPRRDSVVDTSDATLSMKSNSFAPNPTTCQWACDTDITCEAYTFFPSGAFGGTCSYYKKTTEDRDLHLPVQFTAKAEKTTGSTSQGYTRERWSAGYSTRCSKSCGMPEMGWKYRGKNVRTFTNVATWEQCQDKCEADGRCKTFVFKNNGRNFGKCQLKGVEKHRGVRKDGFASGVPCSAGPY
jgi:hypothetical protein